MSGNFPCSRLLHWRTTRPSVLRIFAGPEDLPSGVVRRRKQRLGCRPKMKVPAQIDDQQAITVRASEESEDKCTVAQDPAVNPIRSLRVKDGIFPTKS